ncbi:hypothetical protein AHF37_11504 [Paragonimus kellicotti]|nr:hypothetical protein AHF37_11504 [Paragonimus kellicotti]
MTGSHSCSAVRFSPELGWERLSGDHSAISSKNEGHNFKLGSVERHRLRLLGLSSPVIGHTARNIGLI